MRKIILAGVLMIILAGCAEDRPDAAFGKIVKERKSEKEIVLVVQMKSLVMDDQEKELLARVVHAEAGNQDIIGKRLVVDCVLNRIDDPGYPNTISGVCLQSGQFVLSDTYTAEEITIVEHELWDRLDEEVKYFRTNHYHGFGTPCYQHGDHYFSK